MNPQQLQEVLTQHSVSVKSNGREGVKVDLRGVDLRDADLSCADLRRADLRGADMEGANLRGADMEGADMRGVNLRGASLRGANMEGADMRGVNLRRASLEGANLRWANLEGANLYEADMRGANLHGAMGIPVVVDSGDRLRDVARAALASEAALDMAVWHKCQTAHCVAGWAITLAGETGRILEELHGPELAGRMLLGHEAATHFYDSDEDARAWLLSVLDS